MNTPHLQGWMESLSVAAVAEAALQPGVVTTELVRRRLVLP